MRQLTCKSLSVLLFNICFFILSAQGQDTTKAAARKIQNPERAITPPTPKPVAAPGKKATNPPAPASPLDNSLHGQYEALLKHSWMQQGYKVVNPGRLTNLWKSVNDTLNSNKKQLAEAKRKLNEQEKQIAELKGQPATQHDTPKEAAVTVDQIEVLGTSVDVSTYNWIVWGTILALALGLAAVLATTAKNSVDARQHRQQYEEVSAEYQAYKAKAKEKELRLARELQTERNTIEELLEKKNEDLAAKKGKR